MQTGSRRRVLVTLSTVVALAARCGGSAKEAGVHQVEYEELKAWMDAGEDLEGSDQVLVLTDVGASFWVGSFLRRSRKIMAGLVLTVPLVEGNGSTEPRNGFGVSVFCTFGL